MAFVAGNSRQDLNVIMLLQICLIVASQCSMSAAARVNIDSSTEPMSNNINGSNIINSPNHNSSTTIHNKPWVEIPNNTVVMISNRCERDSECANYSLCTLKSVDDEEAIKVCQCDFTIMKKLNNSCYIKPGHQCFYPDMNSHGYRFIPCFPGSVCKTSVNKTSPTSGYCMCQAPSSELHYREVDQEFEMDHCAASFVDSMFTFRYGSLILCVITIFSHKYLQGILS